MSLHSKIALALVLVTICLGAIIIFVINRTLPEALRNATKQRGISIASKLADRSAGFILTDDILKLKELVDTDKEMDNDIVYVFVMNAKGTVLANAFEEGYSTELKSANSVGPGQLNNTRLLDTGKGLVNDIAAPILVKGEMIGTARVGITDELIRVTNNNVLVKVMGIIIAAIILSIIIGYNLAHLIVKPVKALRHATEEMIKGNLDARVELPIVPCWKIKKCGYKDCPSYEKADVPCWHIAGTMCKGEIQGSYAKKIASCMQCEVYKSYAGDEIQQLSATFNYMVSDLKASRDKIVRSENLAVIGQLASSVAHELRNPLGVMKNAVYYLNMLEIGKDNPDIKENLDIVSGEIENSNKIISDLLEFSRIKQPALRPEDINSIIKETLHRINAPANKKVVTELGENLPQIPVDALQIQQVFYNLAANAIQAMEKEGILTVSSRVAHDETILIAFKDTGCGIKKENLKKIFEPLYSTKAKGTGLGLSVITSIVESHQGKIGVESEAGRGSVFTVKLPINPQKQGTAI